MLSLVTVHEIRRLLDEKALSQRKIALQLEVSRGTVQDIASGRRGLFGRLPEDESSVLSRYATPPERCCSCGGTVFKPCLLCQAREYRARRHEIATLSIARQPPLRRVA